MNNILSLPRVALMALALGTAGVTATFAQTATPSDPTANPPPANGQGGWHKHRHDRGSVLTEAERTQLKAAREKAFAANTQLQSQEQALRAQFKALKTANPPADKTQFEALHQQKESLHQQMRAAELAADPTLGPVFAKLDAAHQGHHRHSA